MVIRLQLRHLQLKDPSKIPQRMLRGGGGGGGGGVVVVELSIVDVV